MNDTLADLFPDGDHRFHLALRRSEPRDFFAPHDGSGTVLAERARWLGADPARYSALHAEGEPLLHEFRELAMTWGLIPAEAIPVHSPADAILRLGRALEPDLLFLSPDPDGRSRLRGGALCFPSGWALEEKLGHTMDFIHGVVPGLNAALGPPIQQFLSKLKPGVAFLRDNWGITATNELNLHRMRAIAAPAPPVALDQLWLRVEHQALLALPRSGGCVFGIRIALHRLDVVSQGPAAAGLRTALRAMPAELAAYKRIDRIRDDVIRLL